MLLLDLGLRISRQLESLKFRLRLLRLLSLQVASRQGDLAPHADQPDMGDGAATHCHESNWAGTSICTSEQLGCLPKPVRGCCLLCWLHSVLTCMQLHSLNASFRCRGLRVTTCHDMPFHNMQHPWQQRNPDRCSSSAGVALHACTALHSAAWRLCTGMQALTWMLAQSMSFGGKLGCLMADCLAAGLLFSPSSGSSLGSSVTDG